MIISLDDLLTNSTSIYDFKKTTTVYKVDIEKLCLNIIKMIHDKHTANVILNSEKLKTFLLRSETRQGCPLLPLLFNTVLEVLVRIIRLGKERKLI